MKSCKKSLVTERCKECMYSGYVLFHDLCCDYMLLTGKHRDCPAGDECTKFKKAEESA